MPGANDAVDPSAAAAAVRSLDGVAVVVGQLEIPQSVTAAAFEAARAGGAVTILNPAPAAALEAELLDAADWLIPNETEFAILAGLDRLRSVRRRRARRVRGRHPRRDSW